MASPSPSATLPKYQSHMDAIDEDPPVGDSTDPLLPQYKDSYPPSDAHSTGHIRLGVGKAQTRRRRAFVFTAFGICTALLLVLATPLACFGEEDCS